MDAFTKLSQDRQTYYIARVNTRWGQLHALEKEWGERAYKYLLLTNSGGAIATLSFLGTSSEALDTFWARWALLSFVFGVVITGVAIAHRFHRLSALFWSYKTDANNFFKDRLPWETLVEQDNNRTTKPGGWSLILPYTSLGSFWIGCTLGGIAMLRAS